MKKEDLIVKWLDNNLDEEELKAFKDLDASSAFMKIDQAAQRFAAPSFDSEAKYEELKSLRKPKVRSINWRRTVASVAAVVILGLGLFYTLNNPSEVTFFAQNNQQFEFNLPDASEVTLNAGSTISYNSSKWEDARTLRLDGEAYFKVAKGKTFTVETSHGTVTVVGTEFTVNARDGFFEVTCYEGLVAVQLGDQNLEVANGNTLKVFHGQQMMDPIGVAEPSWIYNKTNFVSVPYLQVVEEIQRQYDITISGSGVYNDTLFTGSFTHENLDTALQAITIPLNLSYVMKGTEVVLKEIP